MTNSQSDILLQATELYSENPAIITKSKTLTFSELNSIVKKAVANLSSIGFRKGEILAVLDRNSIDYVTAFWTAHRMGLVLMPLNINTSASDWGEQIAAAKCRVLLYAKDYSQYFNTAQNSLPLKMLSGRPLHDSSTNYIPSANDDAVIMFSSGSTGKPNSIVLSRDNLYHSATGANKAILVTPDNTWLAVLPFYHIGGLSILYRAALSGSAVYVFPEFSTIEIISCIEQQDSVLLSVVPTMLKELMKLDKDNSLASCKAIILGGAGFDDGLKNSIIEKRLPVLTTYGMTETSSMVTLLPLTDAGNRLDTSGTVLSEREVKISDDKHILVRGKTVFSRKVDGQKMNKSDDWFDTGDIGRISEDGYLTVTGRAGRMIVSGGENIDLTRIENELLAISGVDGAIVMSRSDKKWGARPVAFVKATDIKLSDSMICAIISDKLGKIYIPDRIVFLNNIPLTGSGKIDLVAIKNKHSELFVESA
ncbi:MAG: acyl--CoA ligase [candidate division Zixibacteria bacterium]|nr:acyl--CoA ligase [candidate division Zixibacteria bacterium]